MTMPFKHREIQTKRTTVQKPGGKALDRLLDAWGECLCNSRSRASELEALTGQRKIS
jgi:hypothetical protein